MTIYVFGNEDIANDSTALTAAKRLAKDFPEVEFVTLKPNANLPFDGNQDVVLMDGVAGLTDVRVLHNKELEKIVLPPRTTAHDFDLGFQLKYLIKLGKLGSVTLIGLPMMGGINYNRIHSIFKKLVAQDMHGS